MAVAEFKLDPRDGRFRFMEVNGRSVIYNGLLRRAGLDLAGLAWSDQVCGQPEPARPNGWPGVWIHLHADVLYSLLYRRYDRVAFADFLAPYRRPKIDAVWSATDPFPFITQWSRTARTGAVGRFGRARIVSCSLIEAGRCRAPDPSLVSWTAGAAQNEATARNFPPVPRSISRRRIASMTTPAPSTRSSSGSARARRPPECRLVDGDQRQREALRLRAA